jgi:hypothetical protein
MCRFLCFLKQNGEIAASGKIIGKKAAEIRHGLRVYE